MLEKLFHLKENKTSVRTELIAGLTTFLAMAYILGVNPSVLGDAGMDVSSVFLATALSAAVASVVMGVIANYPVALAAGMGVNALFFADLIPIYNRYGFTHAETGPQLEDNVKELSQWKPLNPTLGKRRRCYGKSLSPGKQT